MELLQQVIALFDLRTILIVALIFIPLERLFALHTDQPILRREWLNDALYILLNRLPITFGMLLIVLAVMALTPLLVPEGMRNFTGALPLWLQVPAAIIIADIGFYAVHRLFHSVPWLWRFHAVHHSIEEMDWLASGRIHPIDQVLTKGISLIPLFMLGFSNEALAIHSTIFVFQSYFIHSNLRLKFGPLRWLLASPEFHHWHHSNQREAWDKNFAAQLPFLDALFGTAHMPTGRMPTVYGVNDPVPSTYLEQFAYPFRAKQRKPVVATSVVAKAKE